MFYPAYNIGQLAHNLDHPLDGGCSSIIFAESHANERYLITIGLKDYAIMIWKFDPSLKNDEEGLLRSGTPNSQFLNIHI